MDTAEKLVGVINYWHPQKKFGFIEVKNAASGGGYFITRYFLSFMNIAYIGVTEITVGCGVRFGISTKPPRNRSDVPFAVEVEVYESEAHALIAAEEASLATQEVSS